MTPAAIALTEAAARRLDAALAQIGVVSPAKPPRPNEITASDFKPGWTPERHGEQPPF